MAEFEPITTQEAFDVAVADRLAPFADYDDLKAQNADYASRIHAFEMSELKTRIAHEVGIPFDLSQRLTGENEDAIRKDAEDLRLMPDFVKEGVVSEEEMDAHYAATLEKIEKLEMRNMLRREEDKLGAILDINAGAGGTEALDWASMLLRMYTRWGEAHGYKVKVLDYQAGEEVGVKSCTLEFEGEYAYGYLKSENGVHRMVRLSPFNANNKRQTTFASVFVSPAIDDTIENHGQSCGHRVGYLPVERCGRPERQ